MNIFIYLIEKSRENRWNFFDYETKEWIKNFKFVRELGLAFIDISNKVINRKKKLKYSERTKKNNCLNVEDMLSLIFYSIEVQNLV